MNEVDLACGPSPFSKKMCLTLQIGGSQWILARFDSPAMMEAFLALRPQILLRQDVEALKEILK